MVIGFTTAFLAAASVFTSVGDDSHFGVVAIETGSARRLMNYHADERFLMCSTFKFLAAAAVLKQVDEKKDRLDRFVRYTQADILEYAPVTKEHLKDGGMTLGDLCAAAVEQSDNTAGNLLLDAIGGPAGLTKFARSLGDEVTRLDRKEPELNISQSGDERDTTSAAAMLADMQRILLGDVLSASSRSELEKWMQKSVTGMLMIRAGVPADWIVGDKTGRSTDGATNDIAILRPPGRAPILIAIYSRGLSGTAEQRAARIAAVAKEAISRK